MQIRNAKRDALPSRITPQQLGVALSKIDLDSIPPEKRKAAIMDALATIMQRTIVDRDAAARVALAQHLHRKRAL